jgi:hypothetical protein
LLAAAGIACSASAFAQQPTTPNQAPSIKLIVPAEGAAIPADKPVVLFRFAAGDSSDAIDPASFRLAVDGLDRTNLLQLGNGEAWGPLVPDSFASSPPIAPGVHLVHARVCSVRGVCGLLDASVTVIPAEPIAQSGAAAAADSSAEHGTPISLIRMLLELVLALARKLIGPSRKHRRSTHPKELLKPNAPSATHIDSNTESLLL